MTLKKRFSTHGRKGIYLILLLCASPSFSQISRPSSQLFPTPDVLKPNVEFWKNVYAKYSENEVIIHDSWNLGIVYEVVNLESLFRGSNVSSRIQWKKIEQIKKSYKRILLQLSRKSKINIDNLKGKEKAVASLFGPRVTSKQLRIASKRIRAQSGLKERFRLGLIRSGKYLREMKQIFKEEELPFELLALPHVESSFNYKAYSKLGAAGLWQFTRSTGRSYMTINYSVDQRLDPIFATRSAAKLLNANYETLRSWPLAITAYNHGRNGMRRAKRKFGTDIGKITFNYRSRSFGFASRNFYSEFLAALHVSSNYKHYFGELELEDDMEYVEFRLPDYITVAALTQKLDLTPEEFGRFNPSLRSPVLQSKRRIPKNFAIRLPYQENLDLKQLYAQISPKFKFNRQVRASWHRVRSGENLSSIARRYRVSLTELMAVNNVRNAHRIYIGQNLQIPGASSSVRIVSRSVKKEAEQVTLADATDITKTQKASVLDVPRALQLERPADDLQPSEQKQKQRDLATYVPPKAKLDVEPKTAQPLPDKYQGTEFLPEYHISIQDLMTMALPNYHVELDKKMSARIVRDPKIETFHDLFRGIDMPQNGQVVIEPDETLGHFAEWLGVPTSKLRKINKMSYQTPIRVGSSLWLTFENVTPEKFHKRRVEYHQGIEEDFYRNFRIDGQSIYKVQNGDNLWRICNQHFELPHWLLKKYNPDTDLSRLSVGQSLIVPVIEARFPQDVIDTIN